MRTILLCFLLLAAVLPARADQQVEDIFARVRQTNPGLLDYTADINMRLDARVAFVPYRPLITGTYFHKRPDKHKVRLDKAPSYLKKYPSMFGFNLPKLERYNSRVIGTERLNGADCYRIELLPKEARNDVIKLEIWVDAADYTIPRHQTFYKSDGMLLVEVDYHSVDQFRVFKQMRATLDFPKASLQATGKADYTNYRFNQNLPDTLFKKEEKTL